MTLWGRRCRRHTPHRVLLHTVPATTMCYVCTEYEFRPIPITRSVRPKQAPHAEKSPSCQRCYSGSVGGDRQFGDCIMVPKT
jgi:hypothetical protein